jgi:hypothetical protein
MILVPPDAYRQRWYRYGRLSTNTSPVHGRPAGKTHGGSACPIDASKARRASVLQLEGAVEVNSIRTSCVVSRSFRWSACPMGAKETLRCMHRLATGRHPPAAPTASLPSPSWRLPSRAYGGRLSPAAAWPLTEILPNFWPARQRCVGKVTFDLRAARSICARSRIFQSATLTRNRRDRQNSAIEVCTPSFKRPHLALKIVPVLASMLFCS